LLRKAARARAGEGEIEGSWQQAGDGRAWDFEEAFQHFGPIAVRVGGRVFGLLDPARDASRLNRSRKSADAPVA